MSTTAIDGLVTRLGKKSIDNAGDWAKFEQEFPDAELNRLRNESQYAEYIDEIPTGNWTTMLSSMQSSHPNVWNKVKAWTNTALQEKFVAHFGSQGDVLTHLNGSNKLDDILATWQQIATDYQNLSGSFGNLSKANKIKFLDDFKATSNADLQELVANGNELVDVWKTTGLAAARKDVEALKWVKKLKGSDPDFVKLRKHIFEGEQAMQGGVLRVKGVHHKSALAARTSGFQVGDIQIKPGASIDPIGTNGCYKAKVEIFDGTNWNPKIGPNGGEASFFPSAWTKDKTIMEVAYARWKLTPGNWELELGQTSSNLWVGKSSNSQVKIGMYIGADLSTSPSVVPAITEGYGSAFPIK